MTRIVKPAPTTEDEAAAKLDLAHAAADLRNIVERLRSVQRRLDSHHAQAEGIARFDDEYHSLGSWLHGIAGEEAERLERTQNYLEEASEETHETIAAMVEAGRQKAIVKAHRRGN